MKKLKFKLNIIKHGKIIKKQKSIRNNKTNWNIAKQKFTKPFKLKKKKFWHKIFNSKIKYKINIT